MLQNTLCNVKEKLKQSSVISDKRIEKLIGDMAHWSTGMLIYPSRIRSLLHISYEQTYIILNILTEMKILTFNFEIACSECQTIENTPILSSLKEFPKEIYCESGHKLDPLKDTRLLYRVINNE